MATEIFAITSYETKAAHELNITRKGIPAKFPACILCRGKTFLVIVYLLDDSSPVPDNTFLPQHKCGTIFVPRWRYDRLLDMLSNEKAVYCYLNSNTPHKNCFSLVNNLPENGKYKNNEPQQNRSSMPQSFTAHTLVNSFGQQEGLINCHQDNLSNKKDGGHNETVNENFTNNFRALTSYFDAQWNYQSIRQ